MTIKSVGLLAFMDDGMCRQVNLKDEQSELLKAMLPGLFIGGVVSISTDVLPIKLTRPPPDQLHRMG
jgi:hypothetical protein